MNEVVWRRNLNVMRFCVSARFPCTECLLEEAGYFYSYIGLMSRVLAKPVMLLRLIRSKEIHMP
jgi:hypothetical protein